MDKPQEIYNIFKDYFTEDNVDLQDEEYTPFFNIYVRFPKVTITNEYDRSTDITDLFVKIVINSEGHILGTFSMLRTSFSLAHFKAGYIHSHVMPFGRTFAGLKAFQNPCLGTGPINQTIKTLQVNYDTDIWKLFCIELNKYVSVESTAGVPYIRLESIPTRNIFNSYDKWVESFTNYSIDRPMRMSFSEEKQELIKQFIIYVLKSGKIPLSYINKSYRIALSNYKLTIVLSNLFIEWYNTLSNKNKKIMDDSRKFYFKAKCYNDRVYTLNRYYNDEEIPSIEELSKTTLVTFKGVPYKFTLYGNLGKDDIEEQEDSIILKPNIVNNIIRNLILMLNYGRIKNKAWFSERCLHLTTIGKDIRLFS